jgi:uncharacterized protein (DUF2235 family)
MPDETRSNVYKLLRATRVSPDTCIDPKHQIAFYDGGLGSRASGEGIKLKPWRRIYNLLAQATGLGITQNVIDCYAEIIRVWQPGDRIYLFGFSRGAYTVRCVAGVLKHCGVPTAVTCPRTGKTRRLQRDPKSARRVATEAVKHVYQYGSSIRRDPYRKEREARARAFRAKYHSGGPDISNTAPYFVGVWDTVGTLGAGSFALTLFGSIYLAACGVGALLTQDWLGSFWATFAAVALGNPAALYVLMCVRYRGLASLARYRMAFYDTRLHYAVRYARHALSIDENRKKFACVPWEEGHIAGERAAAADPRMPPRLKQMWFAGSHSDIGGSYPETESRLSDIALDWMVDEALSLPEPILIDRTVLRLYPDSAGPQHDERKAFIAACPGWLVKLALLFVPARRFGWEEGHRHVPEDALLHPSVLERFEHFAVMIHGDMVPYRPRALRRHRDVRGYYPAAPFPGHVRGARASAAPRAASDRAVNRPALG